MNHASPSQWLEVQHRQIDQGIEGMLDGSGTPEQLGHSLDLLRLHIYLEEAVLFPPLEQAGLTMPVFVMQREHGQMWPLLQALGAAGASGGTDAAVAESCGTLLQLLQIHNPKEEQILYTAADRIAAEQGDGALLEALTAGRMPAGWACAMAPR